MFLTYTALNPYKEGLKRIEDTNTNTVATKMSLTIHRVAQYARFSSDNQRTESIDAQLRAMNQYCKQQHWQVVATYTDEARSATTDNRPQFQQMITDSGKGMFDIVLVHKLDRFSRDRYDSAILLRKKHRKVPQSSPEYQKLPENRKVRKAFLSHCRTFL